MPRPTGHHTSHTSSHRSSGHRTSSSSSFRSSSSKPKSSYSSHNTNFSAPKQNRPKPITSIGGGPRPSGMHGVGPSPAPIHNPEPRPMSPPMPVPRPTSPPSRRHVYSRSLSSSYQARCNTYDDYAENRRSFNRSILYSFAVAIAIISVFVLLLISVISVRKEANNTNYQGEKIVSTYEPQVIRYKLDDSLCKETLYYTMAGDKLSYFNDNVISGMKYFYQKTGVQPVVMTMDISKVDEYDDDAELNALYSSLFSDEGHFLFIIFGNKNGTVDWEYSWITGSAALEIMDDAAMEIFWSYVDEYYENSNMDDNELVSEAFRNTADDIMQ